MPARLPGLALDLPLLLDLERATAILAAVGSVLIFAVFTSRGYLPTLLGNMLGYQPDRQYEFEREVETVDRRNEPRIDKLDDLMGKNNEVLTELGEELLDLRTRIVELETDEES
jgi:hypothetical protein